MEIDDGKRTSFVDRKRFIFIYVLVHDECDSSAASRNATNFVVDENGKDISQLIIRMRREKDRTIDRKWQIDMIYLANILIWDIL